MLAEDVDGDHRGRPACQRDRTAPLQAERDGTIGQLLVKPGSQVEPSDLLLTLE